MCRETFSKYFELLEGFLRILKKYFKKDIPKFNYEQKFMKIHSPKRLGNTGLGDDVIITIILDVWSVAKKYFTDKERCKNVSM